MVLIMHGNGTEIICVQPVTDSPWTHFNRILCHGSVSVSDPWFIFCC